MFSFYFCDSHWENKAVVSQHENLLPFIGFGVLFLPWLCYSLNFMTLHKPLVLPKTTEKLSFVWGSIAVSSSTERCLLMSGPAEN